MEPQRILVNNTIDATIARLSIDSPGIVLCATVAHGKELLDNQALEERRRR